MKTAHNEQDKDKLLTTEAAALVVGRSRARICQLITGRVLVARKFGRAWMVRLGDLEGLRLPGSGRPKGSRDRKKRSKKL